MEFKKSIKYKALNPVSWNIKQDKKRKKKLFSVNIQGSLSLKDGYEEQSNLFNILKRL